MKLQDLPYPYKELATLRREQQAGSYFRKKCDADFEETGKLFYAFAWHNTPEKAYFWDKVNNGNLPEIPAASLAELEKKSKEPIPEPINQAPALIGGKTEQEWLYIFAGQAMQGYLSSFTTQDPKADFMAEKSIEYAKALLTELKKEGI